MESFPISPISDLTPETQETDTLPPVVENTEAQSRDESDCEPMQAITEAKTGNLGRITTA